MALQSHLVTQRASNAGVESRPEMRLVAMHEMDAEILRCCNDCNARCGRAESMLARTATADALRQLSHCDSTLLSNKSDNEDGVGKLAHDGSMHHKTTGTLPGDSVASVAEACMVAADGEHDNSSKHLETLIRNMHNKLEEHSQCMERALINQQWGLEA